MKLSTRGRYGLRSLLYLEEQGESQPVSLASIASAEGLSEKYLERMFSGFLKKGLVKSIRGAGGGYFLKKNAEDITVLDIIEAIEGPVNLVNCEKNHKCKGRDKCIASRVWENASDVLRKEFASHNIAELKKGAI
ncbi:MAG: RrF2 family transcriptional regulator [Fibrobacterota bacterium]